MNFVINTTTNTLSSTGGIILTGKIFDKIGMDFQGDNILSSSEKEILLTMAGLLVQGRNSFTEVDLVRNDQLFMNALDLKRIFAPETVRIYLNRLGENCKDHVLKLLDDINLNLVKSVSLSSIKTEKAEYCPVDIDVSPMDNSGSNKEGVGRTYKGKDGYAPIFSYIGLEGYMLSTELRPGSQHCQKETPAYLEKTLNIIKELARISHKIIKKRPLFLISY